MCFVKMCFVASMTGWLCSEWDNHCQKTNLSLNESSTPDSSASTATITVNRALLDGMLLLMVAPVVKTIAKFTILAMRNFQKYSTYWIFYTVRSFPRDHYPIIAIKR